MYKYFKISTAVALLMIIIFNGCSMTQPQIPDDLHDSFLNMIPVSNMNKSLRISVEKSNHEDLKFGSIIHVIIENLSDKKVQILEPSGIRLFIIQNDDWYEIKNDVVYYGISDGPILNPAGLKEIGDRVSTWIYPSIDLSNSDASSQGILRIVIVGNVIDGDEKTGISVGAYTDVFVSP